MIQIKYDLKKTYSEMFIIGSQAPLKKKLIPSISKIHDFSFTPTGARIRRVCMIGEGQNVKMAPVQVTTEYRAKIMNSQHLEPNGQPKERTTIPIEKSSVASARGQKRNQNYNPDKRLSMLDFTSNKYIRKFGMETIEDFQPDFNMGGKYLLEKMEEIVFSQNLKDIATDTKRSKVNETLQSSLKIGFAIPIWGEGKNAPTKEAKQFVEGIFIEGQKQKPIPAADVVDLMQDKEDDEGNPMFDENTFLDVDQIKAMFGTLSHSRKRSLSGARKPGSASATVGVDFDDDDNGEAKQEFENALTNAEAQDETVTANKDANLIREDMENETPNSAEHPIKVRGIDLCNIAEKLDWGLNVDKQMNELSREQQEAIMEVIDGDDYVPPTKQRRTIFKMKRAIFNHVKKNCHSVALSLYE